MTTEVDGFATAGQLLTALRGRTLSAVEVLDLHLARIARYNPRLNAIVLPNFEAARATAEAADAARARGEDGTLLGLPITIKDTIEVAELGATAGIHEHAHRVGLADGPLAARVRAAGAVLLGKTNVPPWAGDWQASNPIFGRTNNPWNVACTPGGSTGGGAAALAAGLTPLEFGSDLAGSIRVPAAFCGVYGHRPSETAVPRSGHFPGWGVNPGFPFGVQGPLARCADDLELALDVIAGPETGEEPAWRLELPPPRAAQLAKVRVALMPQLDWLPVRAEIVAALERLTEGLRRAGAHVGVAQPDTFDDLRDYHALYHTLLTAAVFVPVTARPPMKDAVTSTSMSTAPGSLAAHQREDAARRAAWDEFADARARGRDATASDYLRFLAQRERYRAAFRAFFRQWDVFLTPMTPVPAFPHTDLPIAERRLDVDGVMVDYKRLSVYPSVATLSGQPATCFPIGRSSEGLPLGAQAIGPYLEDRTPIRFAALVEREFGGFQPPPGFE